MTPIRLAGIGGLLFSGAVILLNGVKAASGRPFVSAAAEAVAAYYVEHADALGIVSFTTPFAIVGLPLFGVGVLLFTSDSDGHFNPWAIVGLGGAIFAPAFVIGILATDILLATRSAFLPDHLQYTQMLWDLNNVLFNLVTTGSAIVTLGLGMAVRTAGVGPKISTVALVASPLLFVNAFGTVGFGTGDVVWPLAVSGALGSIMFQVFVITVSVKMIRALP